MCGPLFKKKKLIKDPGRDPRTEYYHGPQGVVEARRYTGKDDNVIFGTTCLVPDGVNPAYGGWIVSLPRDYSNSWFVINKYFSTGFDKFSPEESENLEKSILDELNKSN